MEKLNYPDFLCLSCAINAGGNCPEAHLATWHYGICDVCGNKKAVTEPRDFGYPKFKVKEDKDEQRD